MGRFRFVEGPIEVGDYMMLRQEAGWQPLDYDAAEEALANSLYSVCAVSETQIVGCARVVGDGGAYFYIQDVIVLPEYRSQGLAAGMMELIMQYLREEARPGAFVGLMAGEGVSGFFVKYGFASGGEAGPGMFRIWQDPGTSGV